MTWTFNAAHLRRVLRRPPREADGSTDYLLVAGNNVALAAKEVGRLAESLARGRDVGVGEVSGGESIARHIQGLGTEWSVSSRVRVASAFLRASYDGSEFDRLQDAIRGRLDDPERAPWVAHQQSLLDAYEPTSWAKRIEDLARHIKTLAPAADLVLLPACALLHRTTRQRDELVEILADIRCVATGRLTLPRPGTLLVREIETEDAIVLVSGKEHGSTTFAEPQGICVRRGRFSLGIEISKHIQRVFDKANPPPDEDHAVRNARMPWILADLGHHPYGSRHVSQTLRSTAKAWGERHGAGGVPIAVLSSWLRRNGKPEASQAIWAGGVKSSHRPPIEQVLTTSFDDRIEVYDLRLPIPAPP